MNFFLQILFRISFKSQPVLTFFSSGEEWLIMINGHNFSWSRHTYNMSPMPTSVSLCCNKYVNKLLE
uniref:Uncharacterized protein n=1 Tax=Picea sitchensis TaxID=3332 RepID=B8LRX7_PICSI|nr:unknown [Picea sitchensis]